MATRTLEIVLAGDASSASRAFRKVEQDSQRMGKSVDREGKRVHGFATLTSKGFGRVGVAAAGMSAAGVGAAALLAKSFVSGATSINESLTKNRVLFGEFAKDVDAFSKRTAESFGISRQAALEATGTFGNLFVALDIGQRQSAKMSVQLTKLAGDLASFNNASPEEALEAIRSGLVGETEPLRRFGVNLNDATLRAQALKMGIISTVRDALTPQQKALAVNALLFKQTEKAQGDFARTSGGLANQQRILKARFADASAELGGKLMPVALAGVKALNSLFDSTSGGSKVIGFLARQFNIAANAVKRWIGQHREDIQTGVRALRNLATAVRFAFEEVTLPVIRATARAIRPILRSVGDTILGLVRLVTNLLTGQWGKAWDAAKQTASGALRSIANIIRGAKDVLFTLVKSLGTVIVKGLVAGMKGLAGAIKNAVVSGVKSGVSAAKGVVSDVIGAINPFGDGIGKLARKVGDGVGRNLQLPSGGAFGGSLMGADADLRPFAAMGSRFGLQVSSGLRPGAVTSSGNPSFHGSGDAIDMSGSSSGMLAFFKQMRSSVGGRLRELIYTPGGTGIKDGRPYTYSGQVASDHYDHVHVAYTGPSGDGIGQAAQAAKAAGFRGSDLVRAVAIAGPESSYRNSARLVTSAEDSRGMWQINTYAHPWAKSLNLSNPFVAAKAAYRVFRQAGGFGPWTAYSSGSYRSYVDDAQRAIAGMSGGGSRGSRGGGGSGSAGVKRAPGSGTGLIPYGSPWRGFAQARTGGGMGGGDLGHEGNLARIGVSKARAEAKDNLPSLIKALVAERAEKRKRLKLVSRVLKGRISKARRVRLLQEQAQLIGEIGDLNDTIREYKADAKGGATTISRAEELEAGVDTSAGGGVDGGGGGVEADPNIALLAQLTAEMVANQKRIIALTERQGPSLVAAVIAAVNGGIGGRVGLGFQTPGVAGQMARY